MTRPITTAPLETTPSIEASSEPIAILGVGCRLPGGVVDVDSFWRLLSEGVDSISAIEREGFDMERLYSAVPRTPGRMSTRWGGFLSDLEMFDAAFFGISPREAETLAPEQRLLLESTWEALEDATIDPSSLAGRPVSVFAGQWLNEFEDRLFADPRTVDFYATTGSGRYATSGRLSHALGVTGPSITVDTACSSSLVAVHLACQSLRAGESELAIVAGVNVILEPHITIAYSQSGMMAPNGQCRFGDADGQGYVRSEGAVVVVLKPLSTALTDGDPIRAIIRGSAVNNDGGTNGLLATPSRDGQAEMLRRAYAAAEVSPADVGYVEAHGTGTVAGDPIEFGALGDVLALHRSAARRLLVGSVKTNIGHTEGAAGLAGLVKCVLALENEMVPASLHFERPNPAIPWADNPFVVPTTPTEWRDDGAIPRFAGVSAFGITGTNAHVVVESFPATDVAAAEALERRTPLGGNEWPLVISAATPDALRVTARMLADLLDSSAANGWTISDVCASAARHRAGLVHRAGFVVESLADAIDQLHAFAGDDASPAVVGAAIEALDVAFVFPGQGGQWRGMARTLLADCEVFSTAIDRCDGALPSDIGWTVREQLTVDSRTGDGGVDEIALIQPVLLALEIALAETWRAMGVEPDACVGHSMGEVAAAHSSGVLDLQDAMLVICRRSALMQQTSGAGAMAVLEASFAQAEARIGEMSDRIGVAVVNSPRSTVVSGDADAVQALVENCERDGIFARLVNVDVASHGPQMEPLVPALVAELSDLHAFAPRYPLYSTVTADLVEDGGCTAEYWGRNLRSPVRFGPTIQKMAGDGSRAFVELGPHPTLLMSITDVTKADGACVAVGSLRRDEPERSTLLSNFLDAWCHGVAVDWSRWFPDRGYHRLRLGHYPWERVRHWGPSAAARTSPEGARRVTLTASLAANVHELRWMPVERGSAQLTDECVFVGADPAVVAAARSLGARVPFADIDEAVDALSGQDSPVRLVIDLTQSSAVDLIEICRRVLQRWLGRASPPRICWVTRGAQQVDHEPVSAEAPRAASCWGAARVFMAEHPEWWGGLIDIELDGNPESGATQLIDALTVDEEDQLACRGRQLHALRVVPSATPIAQASWRRDAAYLITGGMGAVGLEIAHELVDLGVRRLVLLGRSELPPRIEWSNVDPETKAGRRIHAIRSLEHMGASVHLIIANITDSDALRLALERYAAEGWPEIAAVVHAAGILESELVANLERASIERVIEPKLDAALALDRLFPDVEVFILVSSIMSWWSQVGTAAYAAANAGLDGLATLRRSEGRHALSMQWGAWDGIGMLGNDADSDHLSTLVRDGIHPVGVADSRALFGAMSASSAASLAVVDLDHRAIAATWRARTPLFREMMTGTAPEASEAGVLAEASRPDRLRRLEAIVRHAVGGVLKIAGDQLDAHRPFGSAGLDSLMALEVRDRIGMVIDRPLPATLTWNYPTVESLVSYLASLFELPSEPTDDDDAERVDESPESTAAAPTSEMLLALDGLTDDDIATALRAGQ